MALEEHKLPEDVKIGHITFRKGVALSTLVDRATEWWQTVGEVERLRETLETIAAQDSGVYGSTAKADCMAALASAALRHP